MREKKVAVAMSGGVDSGVAAALLVEKGFKCTGFHMQLWKEADREFKNKGCTVESLEAARKTAHLLGMSFYTLDLSRVFKKQVVDYFLEEYAASLTPNPCIRCNQLIKFGRLLAYVRKLGFDYLATGHYARKGLQTTNYKLKLYHLLQAKDISKDQSYFLYNLTQEQLAHILFPVGAYTKKEVREMAKKWKLPVAERPESQEICFLPESDYRIFLKRYIYNSIKPGFAVDVQDKLIGCHQGLPLYTIGQRHGFTITDRKVLGPLYVIAKNIKKNQLVVGFGREAERKEFWVSKVNWVLGGPELTAGQLPGNRISCLVRIRHLGKFLPAQLRIIGKKIKVVLNEPERGVAPGQAAVFYQKKKLLGGGIIM